VAEQRSAQWYAGSDRNAYIHRAWMRRGLPAHAFDGRPHIAIANTASDLTPCNAHLNEVAESVKQGVFEAGGIPLNLPVISLGETLVRPTAMLWRNMAAMARRTRSGRWISCTMRWSGEDAPKGVTSGHVLSPRPA
jgi:dihydroxy-acid dehydratase